MGNPLENPQSINAFSEVNEVVRTVEVVLNGRLYRVEIRKCYTNTATPFTAASWVEESVKLPGRKEDARMWIKFPLPWVVRPDHDSALAQALGFLRSP